MARLQLDIDFFEPSFLQDPYATYDRIRDLSFGPVWNAALHGWMVVGYEEGSTVVADTRALPLAERRSGDHAVVRSAEHDRRRR